MCGIFGLVRNEECKISDPQLKIIIKNLFLFSQTRGSEAAGIAINNGDNINKAINAINKSINLLITKSNYKIYWGLQKISYQGFFHKNLHTNPRFLLMCLSSLLMD